MVLQYFRMSKPPAEALEAKASAAPVVAFHGAGRVAWSARDTGTMTRVGFLNNPVGFRCVKVIAEAAAAVPLVVQDADRRFEAHPVISLLAAPNPGQGGSALMATHIDLGLEADVIDITPYRAMTTLRVGASDEAFL